MDCEALGIAGVFLVRAKRHEDERGFFSEVYNQQALEAVGLTDVYVQDNHSLSRDQGTVRGLHFQIEPHPIAKLIRVTRGAIVDVVVDIRRGSPTYGQHVARELTATSGDQLYVPIGCAHGFCTTMPDTEVIYKVTDYWSSEVDRGIAWNDPDLSIEWPVAEEEAILSAKDRAQPLLRETPGYFEWSVT